MGKKKKRTLEESEVVSVVEEVKTEETSSKECLVVEEVADDICLEESVESPKDDIKEEVVEEIKVENFPNMGKETLTQVEETQRIPYRLNQRRNTY